MKFDTLINKMVELSECTKTSIGFSYSTYSLLTNFIGHKFNASVCSVLAIRNVLSTSYKRYFIVTIKISRLQRF